MTYQLQALRAETTGFMVTNGWVGDKATGRRRVVGRGVGGCLIVKANEN